MPPPGAVGPAPEHEIHSVTFAPRVMLSVFGSGELKCEGDLCISSSGSDYDHKTTFGIGADVLFKVGPTIRLGPGIGYFFKYDVEPKEPGAPDSYTIGTDLDISFVLDAAIMASPTVWIVPRGQIGAKLVFPDGDLRDDLDADKRACEASNMSGCDTLDGARPGAQFGLGVGVMFAVSPSVRLRADVMYQYYTINLYTIEALGNKAAVNLNGSRGFLMAGAEL